MQAAGFLRFFCSFLPAEESSSQRNPSWHQVWNAGTQNVSRAARALGSGAHRATTAPGFWGTGALAVAVAWCLRAGRRVQISCGTGTLVSGDHRSDLGSNGRRRCSSSRISGMTGYDGGLGHRGRM